MSEISHSDELVTKQDLSNFYQGILPYLGGMPDVVGGGFAPVGTIIAFMGTTAPQDYLSCNGATYNIADYPQLTAFFAAQFGSVNKFGGDGVTTFKVPDLRGEFLRGTGTNSHANQGNGSAVGTHQDGTEISNTLAANGTFLYVRKASENANTETLKADSSINGTTYENTFKAVGNNTNTFQPVRYTVKPTNTSVLYCIKAIESGQVYSTEERIIGTWIDGKPLYQITVQMNTPSTTDGVSTQDITSLNIENVIYLNGVIHYSNYGYRALPDKLPDNSYSADMWITRDTTSDNHDRLKLRTSYSNYTNKPCVITLRYTKTTD